MTRKTWHIAACSALLATSLAFLGTPASAAGDATAGKAIFTKNCAACHGAAASLNFTKPITDAGMAKVIKQGGKANKLSPAMPAFAKLSAGDVDNVIAFIKSMKK